MRPLVLDRIELFIRLPMVVGLAWTVASYFSPAVAVTNEELAAQVQPLIQQHAGEVAVSIRVLDANDDVRLHWSHEGDKVMPTASLIKIPVMIEVYRQAALGKTSLDRRVKLQEADKVPGSGILTEHFSAGAELPLRDAVRLMMRYSDNTATNLVLDMIGLESTRQAMQELGYPETQLHSKVYRRDTSIAPSRSEAYGLGSTTANDTTDLLLRLERRELVSPEASAEMLDHLLACADTSKIPRFLPAGCKVAHKTGEISNVRTAAGIVYTGEQKFVLCVLTRNNQDKSWSDDNAADLLCARVAKAVFDVLTSPDNSSDPPSSDKVLRVGAHGERVESLQRTLNARIDAKLSVDGDFGAATEAAVKSFQKAHELLVTGAVDAATCTALGEIVEEAAVPDPDIINAQRLSRSPALDPHAPPEVTAKAWAILDVESGKLVAGSDSDRPLPMASTTKIMTAYLILELAESSPEVLDEAVTFSQRADDTIGSTSGVRSGEQLPVRELLYGLLLPSGNDAAVALAEHFGERFLGEAACDDDFYSAFIRAMNDKANELGLSNTRFANPHGLTADDHHSSAQDLARLGRAALRLPLMREIIQCRRRGYRLSGPNGSARNIEWENTNRLLGQDGFRGMKTGTTTAAGACLVGVGENSGREQIVVVLGSSSSAARYVDTRNLFAWCWRQDRE